MVTYTFQDIDKLHNERVSPNDIFTDGNFQCTASEILAAVERLGYSPEQFNALPKKKQREVTLKSRKLITGERNFLAMSSANKRKVPTGREEFVCSICNKYIVDEYSNNAQPINDGRCCKHCNDTLVIEARLAGWKVPRPQLVKPPNYDEVDAKLKAWIMSGQFNLEKPTGSSLHH